ncbi:hypothetical protein BABINDRAFT_167724 [Babjeviella inositovora NRRL Y-12698]|uniref:Uncharacterized protein n=1 Tax=Babjeviella inositovora NRRL Y-12698 TaxID=984486 RepID=A0A1E3QNB2_9ASCO|nr:uncharacterized protein BABINDRAFT_167724 [Babjeviella inositovora NRRL Y-12698]ODQ79196.1 hypothetical protein BABINDRAFT_167724 [Babjeviella inositovora NRRL Y-12698]
MVEKRLYDGDEESSQKTTYWLNRRKARKTSKTKVQVLFKGDPEGKPLADPFLPFLQLLGGKEPLDNVQMRWNLYNEYWAKQQSTIDTILVNSGVQLLEDMKRFVESPLTHKAARLSTAIILPGSNISNHTRLFDQIEARILLNPASKVLRLSSQQCPNIRKALASLVRSFQDLVDEVSQGESDDDEEEGEDEFYETPAASSGKKLRYDLDTLTEWSDGYFATEGQTLSDTSLRMAVFIQDAEAFEVSVLSQLIQLFSLQTAKIPLKLVLCVSSSLEIFQERFPRTTLRLLDATKFDGENSEFIYTQICDQVLLNRGSHSVTLGPKFVLSVLDKQVKSSKSIDSIVRSLKYCYMTFFYSQPLSVLIGGQNRGNTELTQAHISALRKLPSFQRHIEGLLKGAGSGKLKKEKIMVLLEDDEAVLKLLPAAYDDFSRVMNSVLDRLDLVRLLQNNADVTVTPKVELYYFALDNRLFNSQFSAEVIGAFRKTPHTAVLRFLTQLRKLGETLSTIAELAALVTTALGDDIDQLASGNEDCVSAAGLTLKGKAVFRRIIDPLCQHVETFINQKVYDSEKSFTLSDILFHELFVIDRDELLASAFSPCVRPTVEDSLVDSRKYLLCLGGTPEESDPYFGIAILIDPIISELFRLYREANTVINIHDFFIAFQELIPKDKLMPLLVEVMETKEAERVFSKTELDSMYRFLMDYDDNAELDLKWEKITLSWFLQGISELSMLGFLKDGNKRSESLEKLIWKGL